MQLNDRRNFSCFYMDFFVLCTPIGDAGLLLDFPLRILFGIRMVISEIVVWGIAITTNVTSLLYYSEYYETTELNMLLHATHMNPYPYWGLILLSGIGTFLSIRFDDELMDVFHHKDRTYFHKHHLKHKIVIVIFFVFVLNGYYELIASLGINTNL
jgi:hypothetical protein